MRILVQRYSALGDILILLPILKELKEQHPDLELALVSRPFVKPLAEELGLRFYAADLNGKHKGLGGLRRLARAIQKDFKPEIIIDGHAVLRSQWLSQLFTLMGTQTFQINKDRKSRKGFLNSGAPSSLKPTYQIHLDNLAAAGLRLPFDPKNLPNAPYLLEPETEAWWQGKKARQNIGVAPSAKHLSKRWPHEHFVLALKEMQKEGRRFFLFGGPDELAQLKKLGEEAQVDYCLVAGQFKLDQEIALMKGLDLFISHDSSNMHMAAWAGCPLISIWGGTVPQAGFAPYGSQNHPLQLAEKLDCQPCSIYGTSICLRGDWACMEQLPPTSLSALAEKILLG